MNDKNINITVIQILIGYKIFMLFAGQEVVIMLDEVTLVYEVLFDKLLKYVFFISQEFASCYTY